MAEDIKQQWTGMHQPKILLEIKNKTLEKYKHLIRNQKPVKRSGENINRRNSTLMMKFPAQFKSELNKSSMDSNKINPKRKFSNVFVSKSTIIPCEKSPRLQK